MGVRRGWGEERGQESGGGLGGLPQRPMRQRAAARCHCAAWETTTMPLAEVPNGCLRRGGAHRVPEGCGGEKPPRLPHVPYMCKIGRREQAAAEADWVFQIDSDDEMAPESFPALWVKREAFDFLVGRRAGRRQPLARKVISFVSCGCVRLFYGRGVWDVNTPYRLMRAAAFAPLYAAIPANTFAPNVILSGLAARLKLRAFEMPVPQHDRTTGEVSIKKWKLLKAAARSFAQTIAFAFRDAPRAWLWGTMAVAVLARVGLSQVGLNFDFESYEIVADIVRQGKTVYAETGRYNYGPLWFYVLAGLKALSGEGFRVALGWARGVARSSQTLPSSS